jgi:hypothetical protein
MTDSTLPQSLSDLIEGFWTTQLIGTAVSLGIPDALRGGATTHQEVARCCQSDPACTLRLLHALQTVDICRPDSSVRFELTEKGRLLCSGVSGSMRGRALFTAGLMWELFGDLQSVVKSGQPTRRVALGRDGFNQLAGQPGLAGMHQAMVRLYDQPDSRTSGAAPGASGGRLSAVLSRLARARRLSALAVLVTRAILVGHC